uniref:R2 protein n=1 Tax=Kalotermes flavicollis TaxID=256709 RepID=F1AQT0_9NEOP|nr:R2 protein [Kalotermes flavicollis]
MEDPLTSSLGSGATQAPGTPELLGEHTVERPGHDQGHSYGLLMDDVELPVRLPFLGSLICPGCTTLLTSEETLVSHHRRVHSDARTRRVCYGCDAPFMTYRAIKCHLPKCSGRKVVTGDHICNGCTKRFESQRGLSLHKRRAHPDLRNEEMLEPPVRAERRPNAHKSSIWSIDEIRILEQYEAAYVGDLHINMKIAAHLPFKTNKQVSNYRNDRRKKSRTATDASQQGPSPNDGIRGIVPSGQSSPLFLEGSDAEGDEDVFNVLVPPTLGGLEPAGQVHSLSEGETSPLVGEADPCFMGGTPSAGEASGSTLLGPDPTPADGCSLVRKDLQLSVQTSPLLAVGSVGTESVQFERGVLSCGTPPDFLHPEQFAHCANNDPVLNASEEQVDAPLGEEADDLPDNNHPSEQGVDPEDPTCSPATKQVQPASEEEADDPLAQLKAWRRRVASYALKIETGVFPAQVDDLIRRLRDGDTNSKVTCEEVEEVVLSLTRTILGGTAPKKRVEGRTKRTYKSRNNHEARKRIMYAICQDSYRRPQRLVQWPVGYQAEKSLLDNQDERPSNAAFETFYTGLWGKSGQCNITMPPGVPRHTGQVLGEVTPKDIYSRLRKLKKDYAPGPDGVTKLKVQSMGAYPSVLAKVYNLVMLTGYFPSCWKEHKTSLIPKDRGSPMDVSNWRPITIGSLLSRIYTGLIERRLRTVSDIHQRQVGFMPVNGCAANLFIFDECIRQAKKEGTIVGSLIDVAKAFDTVPHEAILRALSSQGVDEHTMAHIRDMYSGIRTRINGKGSDIPLVRGVKQGDPLSPMLFNMAMDPLIRDLQRKGFRIGGHETGALAFADDIVLLADSIDGAHDHEDQVRCYMNKLGMTLNPRKSSSFLITAMRKTWISRDPGLSRGETKVPGARPTSAFKYLGVNYTLSEGLESGALIDKLMQAVNRARGLALKPLLRVNLILERIIPKFLYGIILGGPSLTRLNPADKCVRMAVKEIVHLHPSTTDHVLYARKNVGGMGIPRLAHLDCLVSIRLGLALLASEDVAVQAAGMAGDLEGRCKKVANSLRLIWPVTLKDVVRARNNFKSQGSKEWEKVVSQAHGVKDFRDDSLGNCWLYDPTVLSSSRYTDALRLRTNTFGANVALRGADKDLEVNCRRCHGKPETLGHVLGECVATKGMRIRHEKMAAFVAINCEEKGYQTTREQLLSIEQRRLKPDLVVMDRERALIVDVTVRFESGDALSRGASEKIEKYQPLADYFVSQGADREASVLPIVVGSRGAITQATMKTLFMRVLDVERVSNYLAISAVASSVQISCMNLDYT